MFEPLAAPVAPPSVAASDPAVPAPAAAAAPAVPTPAPAAPTPATQSDDAKEPHWLAARLQRHEEAARKSLLKELGVEDPKDAKKALADYKARVEAEKSDLQKANERAASNEAAAKERDVYRAKVEAWAKAEFDKLGDAQKAAIERLAGDDPLKRADAIELLRPTWGVSAPPAGAAAPAAAPAAPTAPAPIAAPANIAPPPAAPRPSAVQTPWEKFKQIEKEQGSVAASLFYNFHSRDIETSRPIA
jgi:pyruvate dehydrogenase E2 component (dihydrolipoamide acetyltransferase)